MALILRALAWNQTAVLFNDGPVFLAIAEAIRSGHWREALSHPYHPLYPLAIAGLALSGLPLEMAAVTVSILGGLLSIAALFALLDRAFDRRVAWAGAWILALHPWAIDFSSDVMSDSLYMAFFLAGLAALADLFATGRKVAAVVSGICAGLAYGTRPEGLGLLGVAVIVFAAGLWGRGAAGGPESMDRGIRPDSRVPLRAILLLFGTAALVSFPYAAHVSREAGQLTLSAKKSVSALARGVGDPAEAQGRGNWARPARDAAKIWLPESSVGVDGPGFRRPSRDGRGAIDAFSRVLRTSLAAFRYELALIALVGWLLIRTGRLPKPPAWTGPMLGASWILYSGLLFLLVWGAGYVSRRHALAAWIPLFGYAALGWQAVFDAMTDRVRLRFGSASGATSLGTRTKRRGGSARGALIALVALLLIVWGPRDLRERRADRRAVRQAAEWIAREHPGSGPVAAQKLRTAYYAEASFVPLAAGIDVPLRESLGGAGARWVVIDERRLADHRGLAEGVGEWLAIRHRVSAAARTALVLSVQDESEAAQDEATSSFSR